jgi:hypothetical protein
MARHLVAATVLAFGPLAAAFGQPAATETSSNVLGAKSYSCVDPSDALALPKIQGEPCKWPMYHLPAPPAPGSAEAARLPSFTSKSTGPGDPMFWRFPVQPGGPFDAPRHSRH